MDRDPRFDPLPEDRIVRQKENTAYYVTKIDGDMVHYEWNTLGHDRALRHWKRKTNCVHIGFWRRIHGVDKK